MITTAQNLYNKLSRGSKWIAIYLIVSSVAWVAQSGIDSNRSDPNGFDIPVTTTSELLVRLGKPARILSVKEAKTELDGQAPEWGTLNAECERFYVYDSEVKVFVDGTWSIEYFYGVSKSKTVLVYFEVMH